MSFDARENKVRDMYNRKIYYIPRNQRGYVWTETNWKELFDDVMCVVDGKLSSHFIGSIVLKVDDEINGLPGFSVIDGQQRIITLTILFSSIIYWMRKLDMVDDFRGTKPYVIATDDKNNDVIMVRSDNSSLESIINKIVCEKSQDNFKKSYNGFIDCESLSEEKNIANAFKFFIGEIQSIYEQSHENIRVILDLRNAVRDITFIDITATTEEDSYTIFEILNARGQDLEDYELLKNYIMRYIQPEGNRDKARDEWRTIEQKLGYMNLKKFIKHYTIHLYGTHNSKEKSDYKIIRDKSKSNDTKKLLRDLEKKSEYYLKLVEPYNSGEKKNCTNTEYRIFSFFKKKKHYQMRPILLSLITKNVEQELSDDLYNKTIEFLYNFYVCYNIIGKEKSNRLTNTINKYSELISNHYSDKIIEDFVEDLKKKLPTKDEFINAFQNIGWSHHNNIHNEDDNKKRVKTVLEVLERYENHGIFCENFTIEHVKPDNESAKNGLIGNLLPLEKHLNEKCKDKNLTDKFFYYDQSSFKITRDFSKRYKSISFDISERTQLMAIKFYDNILKF